MRKRFLGHSELLLTELIIAILVFSVAGAICLQIFAKSHQLSLANENASLAITQTDSAAALLQEADPMSWFTKLYPLASFQEERGVLKTAELYYDADGVPCVFEQGHFRLQVLLTDRSDALLTYHIAFWAMDAESVVYEFDLRTYHPRRKDGGQ